MNLVADNDRVHDDGLAALVGREVSAVSFVRDYVEFHFDGPVLRALTDPFGRFGCWSWKFPVGKAPIVMRYYIGETIDNYEFIPDIRIALDAGEHRLVIPLDEASRSGPEAAHLQIPENAADGGRHGMWIW